MFYACEHGNVHTIRVLHQTITQSTISHASLHLRMCMCVHMHMSTHHSLCLEVHVPTHAHIHVLHLVCITVVHVSTVPLISTCMYHLQSASRVHVYGTHPSYTTIHKHTNLHMPASRSCNNKHTPLQIHSPQIELLQGCQHPKCRCKCSCPLSSQRIVPAQRDTLPSHTHPHVNTQQAAHTAIIKLPSKHVKLYHCIEHTIIFIHYAGARILAY